MTTKKDTAPLIKSLKGSFKEPTDFDYKKHLAGILSKKYLENMKIEFIQINGFDLAEIVSEDLLIRETQDVLDLMADVTYQGSTRMIIHEKNITPGFFDLKTGIAGDILQKFSTYNVHLAIIGDFSKYTGKSLRDFISESNRYGRINFVNTKEEAIIRLTKR